MKLLCALPLCLCCSHCVAHGPYEHRWARRHVSNVIPCGILFWSAQVGSAPPPHMPHTSSATLINYMGHYNIPPCTNLRAEMPLIHILNHRNCHIFKKHPQNSMIWLLLPSDLAEVWIGTMLWAGWTPRGILLDAQTLKSSRVPAAVTSTTLGAWGLPAGGPTAQRTIFFWRGLVTQTAILCCSLGSVPTTLNRVWPEDAHSRHTTDNPAQAPFD